jgi:hypothetical protein
MRHLINLHSRAVRDGKYPIGVKPNASIAESGIPGVTLDEQERICRMTEVEDQLRARVKGLPRRRNLARI